MILEGAWVDFDKEVKFKIRATNQPIVKELIARASTKKMVLNPDSRRMEMKEVPDQEVFYDLHVDHMLEDFQGLVIELEDGTESRTADITTKKIIMGFPTYRDFIRQVSESMDLEDDQIKNS